MLLHTPLYKASTHFSISPLGGLVPGEPTLTLGYLEVLPPRSSISPCSKASPKNVFQSPLPAVPSNIPSLSLGKTKGPKALGVWRKHPFLGE